MIIATPEILFNVIHLKCVTVQLRQLVIKSHHHEYFKTKITKAIVNPVICCVKPFLPNIIWKIFNVINRNFYDFIIKDRYYANFMNARQVFYNQQLVSIRGLLVARMSASRCHGNGEICFIQKEVCEECQKRDSPGSSSGRKPKDRIEIDQNDLTIESLLQEVNTKLGILYKIEKSFEDLRDTVEFYAEQYQKIIEFKEDTEKKYKALENKNIYLEKQNMALEERIQQNIITLQQKLINAEKEIKCLNQEMEKLKIKLQNTKIYKNTTEYIEPKCKLCLSYGEKLLKLGLNFI
ncbi:unnamed protein product [Leptidea sinapis]|uniref:Uncharacterized protein n=1 Tax=Leptidea sinapis TaxID=189913 RepID=A0A5E4PXM9_9NEOP|nr:unnamed protein product [Leptidea sinapis]